MNRDLEKVKEILGQLYGLPSSAIPDEFFDFLKIVAMGARKYAMNNWLEPSGAKSSEKDMHASISRHVAHSMNYHELLALSMHTQPFNTAYLDKESNEDPLLHVITRASMVYTRRKRGLIHNDDK